ncbi:MAG: FKBP-type peptidyl-prolyl cis-trans isomerase [Thermofilum sp.]|jgi:peptidylprolyl isomerase|uniref:peptidylprolyl isomerase n=1 Tax=Thermofilum sp. TaxID=1961369 RepID=UPI00258A6118|nr:peptidylprolyl isomerase [Thermofilum sp.]MCI4408341.1 FKBP-type peptidyl-prolyl cis-trans isomerase [Thermofilum sp.]
MGLQKGEFVLINYTLTVLDDTQEKVIDTTYKEVAEKAGIKTENVVFEPELVIIGEGFVIKPIEDVLVEMNENEKREFVLEPSQAFGERDPKNIVILPARELSSRGVIPRVGEEVEIEGRRGRVIRIGAGRVTIDFNHPFAGKKVKVELTLEKILKDDAEKIRELFHRWFRNIPKENIKTEIAGDTVKIEVPTSIFLIENAFTLLSGFVRDVQKHFENINNVEFVAKVPIERPKKEEEKKEEAPKEESKESSAGQESASQESKAEAKEEQ